MAFRHQRGIAMKHCLVARITEAAEHAPLVIARIGKYAERLIGMSRDHDIVEHVAHTMRVAQFHPSLSPADSLYRRRKPDSVSKTALHPRHIFAATTLHRSPDRTVPQFEQAMIAAEFYKMGCGIGADLHRRGRPDRRRHRIEVIVAKRATIEVAIQIVVERHVAHDRRSRGAVL